MSPQAFVDSVVGDFPTVVSEMIVKMTTQKLPTALVAQLTVESLRTPPLAASRMLQDHMAIDWRDQLGRIDLPMLICAGENDPQAPGDAATASAALMRRARVARFSDRGHCPFIEEPGAFNHALETFMAESGT
jgi:pimeloyl-ACP methyl ester carboxylesterase